jgi:hypothetical protein
MTTPGYDARDVLARYVATLTKPHDGIIRDATELAHPKEIIKSVLQHCIKTIDESEKRSFLRSAYLSLGNFQELTDEERNAVALLGEVGPLGSLGSELQKEQSNRIRDVAIPLQVVMDRLRAEAAILSQELTLLPSTDRN